ncbi:hypothetical protein [Actinacidiphila paucisporea]|uniref:Integral membrane protein n=1 Tax=Actinacidiphila paucisporea TaxID=310782 RepID=A0A1M6V491_9ACTN|nr:hypothetical protein [Actinacidiphila paucisporea]SHK76191.1 hypothetical protein SAMN05216499_101574 [Actinacidiphila paucisporea]
MSQSPPDPVPVPSEAPATPQAAPTPRIVAAAAIAGLEGLAVAAWGVTMLFTHSDNAVLAGLTVLVMAALPLAAAYGLGKVRRWSRGPALIMQLLALPIAWTMLHSSGAVVGGGAFLGALALAGLVCLVHPSTTDALGIRRTTT